MSKKQSKQSGVPSEEFVQLFTRAQRPLYLFILAQVGRVDAAEEILQETNLIIWAKSNQYQPNTNFAAWIRQIATYEILKSRQKYKRDKLKFSDEFINSIAEEAANRSVDQDRQQAALQICLEKLQQEDRELIQQRYRPGISGNELASELGRPRNSVYQSLGRIRRALLECVTRQLATGT